MPTSSSPRAVTLSSRSDNALNVKLQLAFEGSDPVSAGATEVNAPASALLSLAPEIRAIIYKELFRREELQTLALQKQRRTATSNLPSLLRVCRTTYIEALPLFYTLVGFHFDDVLDVSRVTSQARAHIQHVDFYRCHKVSHSNGLLPSLKHLRINYHGGLILRLGYTEEDDTDEYAVSVEGFLEKFSDYLDTTYIMMCQCDMIRHAFQCYLRKPLIEWRKAHKEKAIAPFQLDIVINLHQHEFLNLKGQSTKPCVSLFSDWTEPMTGSLTPKQTATFNVNDWQWTFDVADSTVELMEREP